MREKMPERPPLTMSAEQEAHDRSDNLANFGEDELRAAMYRAHDEITILRAALSAAEAERDEAASRPVPPDSGRARYPMTDIRREFIRRALTHPGFVGDRDLFVDAARDLAAEAAALRAQVEASANAVAALTEFLRPIAGEECQAPILLADDEEWGQCGGCWPCRTRALLKEGT